MQIYWKWLKSELSISTHHFLYTLAKKYCYHTKDEGGGVGDPKFTWFLLQFMYKLKTQKAWLLLMIYFLGATWLKMLKLNMASGCFALLPTTKFNGDSLLSVSLYYFLGGNVFRSMEDICYKILAIFSMSDVCTTVVRLQ